MCQDHQTRDRIEATLQLIVHLLQRLAHESGLRLDEVAWREPVETITPADRRLYPLDFSIHGECQPVGVGIVGGPAPVGPTTVTP
ncbi:MAG: hypothetical protein ACRERE_45280 [Candidatus Entotheonellia bacterium]